MLPVTQIDTFYNGLTLRHRDTINADAGGTFMKRRPEECYDLIENMTAHHNDWDTIVQRGESCSSLTSSNAKIAALKTEMKLHFDLSFADVLQHMPKFATTFKSLLNNKEKLVNLATTLVNENCSAAILKKLLEKLGDPDKETLFLEKLLNDDPSSPLPPKELNLEELKTVKSSIDDPLELELKDLPSHLECAFLEGTNKLPVIIAKNLKEYEKVRLIKVLKSHKRAIAWKLSDIKGIDP
nr:reverse transcriptase domain-containing protein [Tanacetum cinerariifolium]